MACFLGLFALLFGCERTPAEPESGEGRTSARADVRTAERETERASAGRAEKQAPSSSSGAHAAPSGGANGATTEAFRFPAAQRVIAIGDLHGDFAATQRAFSLAGVIDQKGGWSGGETVVVQTGDQLDRGDEERQILEFLERLSKEALAAGGRVLVLNGNHETMNVLGDYRYVTPAALDSFADYEPAAPLASRVKGQYEKRAAAFLPGGGAARLLAQRPLIAMVGDTVFVHGGVLPEHVKYGIDRLNREVSEWMLGKRSMPPPLVVASDGPVWTRLYGATTLDDDACRTLKSVLSVLGADRMVVGHTVQDKGLTSACDDKVFRIDVGLAKYYGERPVQILEITSKGPRALQAP